MGMLLRNTLNIMLTITVLDYSVEDILWIILPHRGGIQSENIVLCIACLPPSEYVCTNDPEAFYCSLLEQLYTYQNEGKMFICRDVTLALEMIVAIYRELMT